MASTGIIAVIFDFDDTLAPDSTTKFLRERGIDTERFWRKDVKALVDDGYDPALAWLSLVLEMTQPGGPLEGLTNEDLAAFGASLDDDFFPGLPGLFDDLRGLVEPARDTSIEFYIISGGLRDLLMGSSIVAEHFDAVYASELGAKAPGGVVSHIKRCVTFTEKTRYLFEINKGITLDESRSNPLLVNKDVPESDRRIQLEDMIYIGDGLTDVPCFSLLERAKGTAFGVFDPTQATKAKTAFIEFLRPHRVKSMHAPRYEAKDELGAFLRVAVQEKVASIQIRRSRPYG
jgi:phosphoserine phosphatase